MVRSAAPGAGSHTHSCASSGKSEVLRAQSLGNSFRLESAGQVVGGREVSLRRNGRVNALADLSSLPECLSAPEENLIPLEATPRVL